MIAFDISDNRRRYRVVRALRDYGERVQRSVFECHLSSPERRKLLARLDRLMRRDIDRLHVFEFSDRDVKRIDVLGFGEVTRYTDFLLV